jgi:hypothetical protein
MHPATLGQLLPTSFQPHVNRRFRSCAHCAVQGKPCGVVVYNDGTVPSYRILMHYTLLLSAECCTDSVVFAALGPTESGMMLLAAVWTVQCRDAAMLWLCCSHSRP